MRHLCFSVSLALMLFLSACGGSKPTVKKKEEPVAPPPAAPTPSTTVSTPPPQPKPPVAQKPADAPPAVNKPAGDAAKPAVTAPSSGDAGFNEGLVGGRPISEYILKLDSKNKDEVIEAISACSVAKPKKCIEKITELTKSPDKEIAAEATDALRKIGAGR